MALAVAYPEIRMKQIQLTRGYFALIDDADFDHINQWKWHALVIKRPNVTKVYAVRNEGTKKVYMHRALMDAPSGIDVDHKDDNGLNNQRENLRIATRSQNNWNSKARKGSTPYVGVTYLDPLKPSYAKHAKRPYQAYVQANKKKHHVGFFETAEAAAEARDRKAVELYGTFAALNFPEKFS